MKNLQSDFSKSCVRKWPYFLPERYLSKEGYPILLCLDTSKSSEELSSLIALTPSCFSTEKSEPMRPILGKTKKEKGRVAAGKIPVFGILETKVVVKVEVLRNVTHKKSTDIPLKP